MGIKNLLFAVLFFALCSFVLFNHHNSGFLYNFDDLKEARILFEKGDPLYNALVKDLTDKADQFLLIEPPTIANKKFIAPSGDKHDYYSIGPYWWPDPDSDDGLPYIRHDGKRNPERNEYDRPKLGLMAEATFNLSQAYFYTQKEAYAEKAIQFLSTWFVNPETKMNPHLEYGQAIPGRVEGRGIGIIETGSFLEVIHSLEFLKESEAVKKLDMRTIKRWFEDYLDWLLTSEKGWDERMWHNNHGSSYDSQVTTYAMFVGKDSVAQMILDSVKIKRIDRQIESDGRQPWELERTKSMGYSLKNLLHLMENAILAENYDMDLWNYQSSSGGSIKKAVQYLIPFMMEGKDWPYTQYDGIGSAMDRFYKAVWIASIYLDDEMIDQAAASLMVDPKVTPTILLLYPDLK